MPDDQPQQPAAEDQPDGEHGWLDDDAELSGLVLIPGSEPVPAERVLVPEPADLGGGVGGGLCWSFEVDLDAILTAAAKGMPGPGAGGVLPGLSGAGRGSGPAPDQVPGAAASPGSPASGDPSPGQASGDPSPGQKSGDVSPGQASGDASLQACGDLCPAPPSPSPSPSPGPGAGGVVLPDEGGLGVDVVAEYLPGSAGLAGWLEQRDPAEASDYDLPAVAAGWRRVAAWAQAREFAAIAQIAVRSAARNEKAGLEEDGRPAAVTPDAAAQVGLALALSPGTAEWWTSQAVTLTWRLPATGAALAAGQIDAYRARLITEATSLLEEDTARAVENDVLPGAGELTYAQLRSRLRRAVIIADPQGAEERRKAAERRARVSLYPDDDGTATLTGTSLPAPHAAAAMARITALARALKASGAGGGTDLLRAHIYLGLLLGTLPPIPPPAGTGQPSEPTDDDPPSDDPPSDDPPSDDPPHGGGPGGPRGDGQPGSTPPGYGRPAGPPSGHGRSSDTPTGGVPGDGRPGGTPPGGGQHPGPSRGSRPPRRGQPSSGPPPYRDQSSGSPAHRNEPAGQAARDPSSDGPRPGPSGADPPGPQLPGSRPDTPRQPGPEPPATALPGNSPVSANSPGSTSPGSTSPGSTSPGSTVPGPGMPDDDGSTADLWPGAPSLTDADAPDPDDGYADPPLEPHEDDRLRYGEDPLDLPDTGPVPVWPAIPGTTSTSPLTTTGTHTTDTHTTAAGRTGTARTAAARTSAGRTSAAGASAAGASAGRTSEPSATTGVASSPGRPGGGMLDLTLSWATFAESASAPGILGRIGPVTATQARVLAAAATNAPGTRWRVILTDHHGRAIKTATVTRRRTPATKAPVGRPSTIGPMLPLTGPHASITGRVSVTIPVAVLDQISAAELAGTTIRAAILRAAAAAAARARRQAIADKETDNGCAHTTASPAYRPPATIRDLVEARDLTCRFPGCRQPAWRGDLDHTTAFHCGGLTCPCNLGPLCRRHHRLKQEQHWALTQTSPGTFRWHTSAGRIHITTAARHAR